MQTLKLDQLILDLISLHDGLKEKGISPRVFMASDEEGNLYGSLDVSTSFAYDEDMKAVILYPHTQAPPEDI